VHLIIDAGMAVLRGIVSFRSKHKILNKLWVAVE
jgi:hypothetical protein